MLVAFKEELKRLAVDASDPFHLKIRQRVGKKATWMLEDRLKRIILIMPNLTKRIQHYWDKEDTDHRTKKLGGFVLAYLYNPRDLLAQDEHGLFGYLDDAYLVADVYARMLREVPFPEPVDREYLETIAATKRYVQAVIPDETRKIEAMVDEALNLDDFSMFASSLQGAV